MSSDPITAELKTLHEGRKAALKLRLENDKARLVSFLESACDQKKYDLFAFGISRCKHCIQT
jgi:hypothetical protein